MDFGRLGVLKWVAGGAAAGMGGTEPPATTSGAATASVADASRERFAIKKSYSIEVSRPVKMNYT